jgi:hypothetical protein
MEIISAILMRMDMLSSICGKQQNSAANVPIDATSVRLTFPIFKRGARELPFILSIALKSGFARRKKPRETAGSERLRRCG